MIEGELSMGPFDKPSDPRGPAKPRQSGDNVPLLPLRSGPRRGSLNQNIWNDGPEEDEFALHTRRTLLAKKSNDSFHEFLEEEDEDTDRLLGANEVGGEAIDVGQTESDLDLEDEAKLLEDDSPYEEVRAAVSNTDDPSMACVLLLFILTEYLGDISCLGHRESFCNLWLWSQYPLFHACSVNLSINPYCSTSRLPHWQSVGQVHA